MCTYRHIIIHPFVRVLPCKNKFEENVFHYKCQILTQDRLRNSVLYSFLLQNPVNPNNYPMSIKKRTMQMHETKQFPLCNHFIQLIYAFV